MPEMRNLLTRLALLAFVLGGLGACSTLTVKDDWARWQFAVKADITHCAKKAPASHCLSAALKAHKSPAPDPDASVAARFQADINKARLLDQIPAAREELRKRFGIYADDFLGTGFSAPNAASISERSYAAAWNREYLVKNLCAEAADPKACPQATPGFFAFALTPDEFQAARARSVEEIWIARAKAAGRADLVPEIQAKLAAPDPAKPVLLRLSAFDKKYYVGLTGRPDSERVFFADLGGVEKRTLSDALASTGSAALVQNGLKPDERLFVWIYLPGDQSTFTIASWASVFDLLEH